MRYPVGVAVVFGDFDFPITGVKVQDPESKKTIHDQFPVFLALVNNAVAELFNIKFHP